MSDSFLRGFRRSLFFALFFGLIVSPAAHAYLDPGSGSFFVQILIAMLVAIPLTFKVFFHNLFSFFKKLFRGKQGPDSRNQP